MGGDCGAHHALRGWRPPELDKVTVEQWVDLYLAGATNKRESTLRRDRAVLRDYLLPTLAHVPIRQVRALDIKQIVEPLADRLAPATIRGIYGLIAATFRAAVEADVLSSSPCRGVKRPTEHPTKKRFLTIDELERLADAFDPDYRAFVIVKGTLGLRFSEMAGLRVGDVDFFRRTLSVQRTIAEVGGHLSEEEVKSPASRRTMSVPQFVSTSCRHTCEGVGPSRVTGSSSHLGAARSATRRSIAGHGHRPSALLVLTA